MTTDATKHCGWKTATKKLQLHNQDADAKIIQEVFYVSIWVHGNNNVKKIEKKTKRQRNKSEKIYSSYTSSLVVHKKDKKWNLNFKKIFSMQICCYKNIFWRSYQRMYTRMKAKYKKEKERFPKDCFLKSVSISVLRKENKIKKIKFVKTIFYARLFFIKCIPNSVSSGGQRKTWKLKKYKISIKKDRLT